MLTWGSAVPALVAAMSAALLQFVHSATPDARPYLANLEAGLVWSAIAVTALVAFLNHRLTSRPVAGGDTVRHMLRGVVWHCPDVALCVQLSLLVARGGRASVNFVRRLKEM